MKTKEEIFVVYIKGVPASPRMAYATLGHAKSAISVTVDNLCWTQFLPSTSKEVREEWKIEKKKEYTIVRYVPDCIVFMDITI